MLKSRAGWSVVAGLILLVSLVAGMPYAIAGKDAQRPGQDELLVALTLPADSALASLPKARVAKIIDGDTIDVALDGKTVRVRYYGVDTPERGERCYREATDRNELLLGKEVLLLTDARSEDRFGRSLRYVFLPDGTTLDATLVAEGFGRAWTQDGRYKGEIMALQSQAEAAGRGCLWK